jgi:amino acid transporter
MSAPPPRTSAPTFARALGLRAAVAVNMTQMCGIGPFVTIPLMVATVGGPQAILGWVVGALLAIADGIVWAELGAAMPGSGGTYLYLREAFQYTTGRLMPFLFIWSAMVSIPLVMSTGVIGLVKYLGYYFPGMTAVETRAASLFVIGLVVVALYRNISAVAKLAGVLWIVMLLAVGAVTIAAFSRFDPRLAFTYPEGAFHLSGRFFAGMGSGLIIAVYDYLGYNTVAYMGDELRDPGRVMPRAILYSIVGMMVIYLTMNVAVVGAMPWQEIAKSESVGSTVLERAWGVGAARVFTALIVLTAFASLVAGLLGASRVPYNAAKDKLFFAAFGRLHPTLRFPHVSLLVMAAVTAVGSFFTLTDVINVLTAVFVLVQSIAQIAALTVLRRRQPTLERPYRAWLYPLPSLVAGTGWLYVYVSSGLGPVLLSLGWVAAGVAAFTVWARVERTWPFGPKEIREDFLAPGRDGASSGEGAAGVGENARLREGDSYEVARLVSPVGRGSGASPGP